MHHRIIVTGAAGFIGSALARYLVGDAHADVLVVDKLTYAGDLRSLDQIKDSSRFNFVHADICDKLRMDALFAEFSPDAVMHLAAESHVDRSIDGPEDFIRTNVVGTYTLLQSALGYWKTLRPEPKAAFRFLHVSTDEVYGALGAEGSFNEKTPYDPRSPYSASKASSDHLARAWHHTYGLPLLVTNCSNNYGPYQFPEKLIPLTIINALAGKALPVYGKGENIRDWLHVEDHVRALHHVLGRGRVGESYNIGGEAERANIQVVHTICDALEAVIECRKGAYRDLVSFVVDRPGHDYRYAINCRKLKATLGWLPQHSFESGLAKTVQWYVANETWWRPLVHAHDSTARRGLETAAV